MTIIVVITKKTAQSLCKFSAVFKNCSLSTTNPEKAEKTFLPKVAQKDTKKTHSWWVMCGFFCVLCFEHYYWDGLRRRRSREFQRKNIRTTTTTRWKGREKEKRAHANSRRVDWFSSGKNRILRDHHHSSSVFSRPLLLVFRVFLWRLSSVVVVVRHHHHHHHRERRRWILHREKTESVNGHAFTPVR